MRPDGGVSTPGGASLMFHAGCKRTLLVACSRGCSSRLVPDKRERLAPIHFRLNSLAISFTTSR
jgi:hypothetical protein